MVRSGHCRCMLDALVRDGESTHNNNVRVRDPRVVPFAVVRPSLPAVDRNNV